MTQKKPRVPKPGEHADGSAPNTVAVPTHGGTYAEQPDGSHERIADEVLEVLRAPQDEPAAPAPEPAPTAPDSE